MNNASIRLMNKELDKNINKTFCKPQYKSMTVLVLWLFLFMNNK